QLAIGATDADGDPLVYWADNLPPGAVFDPVQHQLTWTPGFPGAGTYANVRFTVSDGLHRVSATTTLVIAPSPPAPTLVRPPDRPGGGGARLRFKVVGAAPAGTPLPSTADTLPAGAFLDPKTGVFTWTPTYDQHGVYDLPITVGNGFASTTRTTEI